MESNRTHLFALQARLNMMSLSLLIGALSLCVAQEEGYSEETSWIEASSTNLLQFGQALRDSQPECGHLTVEACDPRANAFCSNNCRIHTHGADCYRPVPDVMAEHPGEDGYCYFNATAFWVSYSGPNPHFEKEAAEGVLFLRGPSYKGLNTGPLLAYSFEDAVNLTTYADSAHYLYDDLYAYSLGFLQGLNPLNPKTDYTKVGIFAIREVGVSKLVGGELDL